jgi:hypothetical protein
MVRIMFRTMIAFAGLAALAVPAAAAERRYSVTDFERIVVEGPFVVRLVTGRPTSVSASGPQDAIDRAAIDVSGQTLRIRRNTSYWGGTAGAQRGVLTVMLSTRNLRSVRLIGPARFEVDHARGQRIELVVEGSGRLVAPHVDADTLELGLRGGGKLEIAGRAGVLRGDFQGTGDVDGAELTADNATISTTTMGNVSLAARTSASVTANGIGEVVISGRPACTVRGQGAGQVRCGDPARR